MSYDYLTSTGIDSLISAYTTSEQKRILTPLTTRQSKYQNLISGYSSLSSKLSSLSTALDTLKATGSSSAFVLSRNATLSNSSFFSVSGSNTTPLTSYSVRVSQLAKTDMALSSTLTSASASSVTAGLHTLRFRSGSSEANVDVNFTSTETNKSVMDKIKEAVNASSAATVRSGYHDKAAAFTMDSSNNSFDINVNGSTANIAIDESSFAGITNYENLTDAVVKAVNDKNISVRAEKVFDSTGNNVGVKFTSVSNSTSLTINSTGLDGSGNKIAGSNSLMNSLGVNAYQEKGASSLLSSSVFSPTADSSKLTFAAQGSGYSNRLIISSDDALTQIGFTSDILSNRYKNSDDGTTTNESEAGFTSGTQWLDSGGVTQGTAESSTSNLLNSKITFNGVTVQRDSNTISDLVSGMSISLKSAMKDTDANVDVTIGGSVANTRTQIENFVSKFNDAYLYLKTNSSVSASTSSSTRGIFAGDATSNSLISSLTNSAITSVSGIASGDLSKMQQLGITFNSDNGLLISDSTKLDSMLNTKMSQVESMFNSTSGIAATLSGRVKQYIGSDGYLTKASTTFDKNVTNLSTNITSQNASISKRAELLRSKYAAMQLNLAIAMAAYNSLTGSTDTSTS